MICTQNIRHLADKLFVPLTQGTSVSYSRFLQPIHYDQLTRESDIFHFQTEIDLNEKTIQTISVPDNIAYTFCKPNLLVLQELFSFLAAFWLATFKSVILECDFSLFNALKYYSGTDADGKTFILVFCVMQTDSTQLFT